MSATARFVLIEDYFLWRLTGEYVSEGSLLTSTCYWDFRTKAFWPEMLDALGIDESRLPGIVEPGVAVGKLLPEVAREPGPPSSTTVCTGALYQACGAIGVGTRWSGSFQREHRCGRGTLCHALRGRLDPGALHAMPLPRRSRYVHVPHIYKRRCRAALVQGQLRRGRTVGCGCVGAGRLRLVGS